MFLMGWTAMSMAMLQHVHDQAEDLGQAASLKAQIRDLKDDMVLKEALIKSARESESRATEDLASLKEKLSRMVEDLSKEKEKNVGLDAENLKLKDEVSHLKAKVEEDGSALSSLRSELQESASRRLELSCRRLKRSWRKHIKTRIPRWMILTGIV
jgi:chromosome segregation ATPase